MRNASLRRCPPPLPTPLQENSIFIHSPYSKSVFLKVKDIYCILIKHSYCYFILSINGTAHDSGFHNKCHIWRGIIYKDTAKHFFLINHMLFVMSLPSATKCLVFSFSYVHSSNDLWWISVHFWRPYLCYNNIFFYESPLLTKVLCCTCIHVSTFFGPLNGASCQECKFGVN